MAALPKKLRERFERHVPFDEIATRDRGVAACQLQRDREPSQACGVLEFLHIDAIAGGLHRTGPTFATTATPIAVNRDERQPGPGAFAP